jgi:CRP-like cAMP-binding protein
MTVNPALEKFVRSIPLFELVGEEHLTELLRLLRQVNLTPGEVLFRQGDRGNAMWVLGPGTQVALSVRRDGLEVPLTTLGTNETLGEMALIDDGQRSATATVLTSGLAYRIEGVDFDVLRNEMKPAAFGILRKMAADLCGRLRMVSVQIVPEGTGKPDEGAVDLGEGKAIHSSTLESFGPLKDTPATGRLALAQKLTEHQLTAGQAVFHEGASSDGIYFLVSGEIETRRRGKGYLSLGPGNMFGLVSVIDGGLRSGTCVARSDAIVWRLLQPDFERLFSAGHRFAYRLVELVARQLASNVRQANATLVGKGDEPPAVPTDESLSSLDLGLDLVFEKMMA